MWNEFINCTIDNEDWFQKNVGPEDSEGVHAITDSNTDKRNGNSILYLYIICSLHLIKFSLQ